MSAKAPAIPIAVVGMSAIYPGETGLAGFWRTITSGRDAISDVPPSHWLVDDYYDADPTAPDKTYCRRGGFIEPVPFDPMQFGLPPTALPSTDSAQLLALIAAKQALDQASRGNAKVDPDRISVVLGVASTTELVVQMGARLQHPIWRKALLENGLGEAEADEICRDIAANYAPWQESTFPGLLGNVVAGRIANRLNLGGSNYVTDAACASSLSALQVALHELYLDEADMVLTGGVDALNDIMMFMCFSKTPAFSPTGDCRPFSDAADGTIIGEGVGMLALKRLSDAERDGDPIHAVIRGLGSSSDGRASSVYAPRSEGQAKALRRAYERAGYGPETVTLLEAHGTATKAGDAAEFSGLASVFPSAAEGARCALGSVKSQIGHTKAAAGAAGLIKAVLSLQHGVLPGTAKVSKPNPLLGLEDTGFYVNAQTRPWIHAGVAPRRASVSSFGFGGSNFHVTLEEYRGPQRAKRLRALPNELVLLSAGSEAALIAKCAEVSVEVRAGQTLARLAFERAAAFKPDDQIRVGIVASDTIELLRKLESLAAGAKSGNLSSLRDPDVAISVGEVRAGKTAFLFPGQGSQYLGMGADLARAFPEALAVWDELPSDVRDIAGIVHPEPAFDESTRDDRNAALTRMANAQPAIAAMSLSHLALLDRLGVKADAAGGHSFGEVAALAAAGIIAKQQLIATARVRGTLMTGAAAGRDGAMLALACSATAVEGLFAKEPELRAVLVVANDNSPGQVVLSGATSDIQRAEALAKDARITAFRLPVASAFHSPIVADSCEPFEAHLKTLKLGRAAFPVYANATARPYARGVAHQLAEQLGKPVRFREMIEAMAHDGVTRFIEVGPGRVLTGLVTQILASTPHLAVALDDRKADDLRAWHRGLAALAADGVALNFETLFESYETPAAHTPAPAHAVMVGGANLGKPYPPLSGKREIVVKDRPARAPAIMSAPQASSYAAPPPENAPASLGVTASATLAGGEGSGDVWALIDRIQGETAEQHRRYLDTMAQSHQAFLEMSSQMLAQITGAPAPAVNPTRTISPTVPTASVLPAPPSTYVPSIPKTAVISVPQTQMPALAPLQAASASAQEILLQVVSDKTGYPIDMLTLDMEMEAELGIDSIKQVEILSAMQARFPEAPEIAASELSKLRTLRDVADKMSTFVGQAPPMMAPTAPIRSGEALNPAALSDSVLAVVAEKTGYPVDMLGLDMELEAELGIDSIKQVEILSALQDRWPDAPEVPASELSRIKTLRDVVAALGVATQESKPSPPTPMLSPPLAPTQAPYPTLKVTVRSFVESPATGFAMIGLRDVEIVVTDEDKTFSRNVVKALKRRGLNARSGTPKDGDTAVISLAGYAGAVDASQLCGLHLGALRAMRVLARSKTQKLLFVAVHASEDASSVPLGLSGMVRTAVREWPHASVKIVRMDERDADRLVTEILEGGGDIEVQLGPDGARSVARDVSDDGAADRQIDMPRGGLVVVSGGARGVTASCALSLAERYGLRLLLLGRTNLGSPVTRTGGEADIATALVAEARASGHTLSLVDARRAAADEIARRDIHETLKAARALGVEATYAPVEITDAPKVALLIDSVRQQGAPIVGVIHGAGVLADRRIDDLDDESFTRVFSTKVAGAEALLHATRHDDLKLVAFFSSIAAFAGNAGQCAYAAANAVLNAMARREAMRRGAGCAVHAFGWGPWDGGMVDATLKQRFASAGVEVIPKSLGAAFFARHAGSLELAPDFVVAAPALEPPATLAVEWLADPRRLPLADHAVRNRMVLPVVVVLERILRAAQSLSKELVVVEDLQVLSGVTWSEQEADTPTALSMTFEPHGDHWNVTLRDGAHRPRYRAVVRHEPTVLQTGVFSTQENTWPIELADAYAGPLFHGPRFAALEALETYGSGGGSAMLRRIETLGWAPEPWVIDPAALDGGLQLGLLWAAANERPLMLPQKIGRFAMVGVPSAATPLRCRFQARPVSDKRIDFDFLFESMDGAPIAVLHGGEYYSVGAGIAAAP